MEHGSVVVIAFYVILSKGHLIAKLSAFFNSCCVAQVNWSRDTNSGDRFFRCDSYFEMKQTTWQ